jgi:hypothetical protein
MGFLTADTDVERWLLVALTAAIVIGVIYWLWRETRRDDVVRMAVSEPNSALPSVRSQSLNLGFADSASSLCNPRYLVLSVFRL